MVPALICASTAGMEPKSTCTSSVITALVESALLL